jgi:hypothetical protein
MSDKTPLERDIESRELVRTPGIIKLSIFILLTGLFVVTIYSFVLKQEIAKKDQEIIRMQEKFQNEKSLLLQELKELRNRIKSEDKNGEQTD